MELPDKDRLVRWLDGAMQQYGSAEPRAGIEQRLLANLSSERDHVRAVHPWWWMAGAVAVTVLILTGLWTALRIDRSTKLREVAISQPRVPSEKEQGQPKFSVQVIKPRKPQQKRRLPIQEVRIAKEPRLDQFPSPRPLGQEEELLTRYVNEFPKEAVEVAREQMQAQKEMESLYSAGASDLQQER